MEKEYKVWLMSYGEVKLQVVKLVRDLGGYGLAEAKHIVDHAPSEVCSRTSLEDAKEVKRLLEKNGAKVRIEFDSDEEQRVFDYERVFGGEKYYCVLNNQSFGPVTFQQLINMAQFEVVKAHTLVWTEGMSEWQPAKTFGRLALLVDLKE